MTIIDELLNQVETKDALSNELKIVCDSIMTEELPKMKNAENRPKGPNIFLSVEEKYNGIRKDIICNFLTLEREINSQFVARLYLLKDKGNLICFQSFPINEDSCKKILMVYASILKNLKGN